MDILLQLSIKQKYLKNSSVRVFKSNLTEQRWVSERSLPPHSAVLSAPGLHSPIHGSSRSHDPTPEGWSPHLLGCLCLTAHFWAELLGRQSGLRRAEVTGNHRPDDHSTADLTDHQVRLVPVLDQRMTLQCHHLRAKKTFNDTSHIMFQISAKQNNSI